MKNFAFFLTASLCLNLCACGHEEEGVKPDLNKQRESDQRELDQRERMLEPDCGSIPTLDPEKLYMVGGEFKTKRRFLYGSFKTTVYRTKRPGVVASFFLYDEIGEGHEEIDYEFLGSKKQVQTNFRNFLTNTTAFSDVSDRAAEDGVELEFQWTPDTVKWLIDGKLVRKDNIALRTPKSAHFNLWGSAACTWAGPLKVPAEKELLYRIKSFSYAPYLVESKTFGEHLAVPLTSLSTESGNKLGNDWLDRCGTFPEYNVTLFHPKNVLANNSDLFLKLSNLPTKHQDDRQKVYAGYCPNL